MSVTTVHDSALLDQVVVLVRQGIAPLEACRATGYSYHAYGFAIAARPELAREFAALRTERTRAGQRRWRDEQHERSVLDREIPELLYCGHCGSRATATPWGSGVLVRCPDCGPKQWAGLQFCTLDGQPLSGHERCHVCSQLMGRAHHHPAGVCLSREMRLPQKAATR
jgi:hypothetical protein